MSQSMSREQPVSAVKRPLSSNAYARQQPAGPPVGQQDLEESSPVMVNPSMAEDVDILERHLASQTEPGACETRPYVRLSTASGDTIVYRTVAKRRKGLWQSSTPGATQLEIIENVLGSLKTDVIKLYDAY